MLSRFRTAFRFLGGCMLAVAVLLASPMVEAHGDGTTGGELFADKEGEAVSLTLSYRGMLSAGVITSEMAVLPDLFDSQNRPLPDLVSLTRLLLVFRVGETVVTPILEPGPIDPEGYKRMLCLRWPLPPGSRSFSIERCDPDTKGGIASWVFTQMREDGTQGEVHYAQAMYGQRITFAVTTKLPVAPEGETAEPTEPLEPVTETGVLGVGSLLWLGFRHIVPEGLDHVLFILALFLPVPRFRPLLAQATAFTLAHSVTLGLAMAGLVVLPSRAIEIVIALSILVMALGNLRAKNISAARWTLVFLFGLVHGLGFAGSFAQLKASPGDLGRTLLFLNLGIELAQISVLMVLALLVYFAREKTWYRMRVTVPISIMVAMFSAWLVVERAFCSSSP